MKEATKFQATNTNHNPSQLSRMGTKQVGKRIKIDANIYISNALVILFLPRGKSWIEFNLGKFC